MSLNPRSDKARLFLSKIFLINTVLNKLNISVIAFGYPEAIKQSFFLAVVALCEK
jgi:hypothetical protein